MKNNQLIKSLFIGLVLFIAFTLSNNAQAQYNPYDNGSNIVTIGVGASGWGVPIYASLEIPVADNITAGGILSYQSYSNRYSTFKYRHTIFGIGVLGNYHFNELLQISDEWDVYAGLTLGYYIWNSKYDGSGSSVDYSGPESSGIGLGAQLGGRYFFKDNLAVNVEVGGGYTALSNGKVGLSIFF
ncbi:hypothetical protein [Chondrinema litorale]|uniref:hypothetical protein n=1 Tax=Chondrinema litorale TaxID=2994555 RepID=UPI0025434DC3|nr:hypothetical protein [Chondrinema litorale]UZR94230.1 hypothetical protein OQ292_00140 [Chondrinema litorale]